ncbi:hypothetical protein H632_c3455p0, partial [Helicosporidium sp. ATCC 50920]
PARQPTQYSRGLLFGGEAERGGLPFRAAESAPVSTLDVVIDLDDLVASGDDSRRGESGEDGVEWEDVDSEPGEGGASTSRHLFPSDLSRDASNPAAAVSGAAENLGLREQPDLHWRERANRRQKFWSMSHGFQMGRKLGDWGRDEHSRGPESSQEPPPEVVETDDAQVERAIELSLQEDRGSREKGKQEVPAPPLERPRAAAAQARAPSVAGGRGGAVGFRVGSRDGAVGLRVGSRDDASAPKPGPSSQTALSPSAPGIALAARINASSASALEEKIGPRPGDEMGERGLSLEAEKILDALSRVEEAEGASAREQEEVQLSEADDDAEEWKAPGDVPLTAAPGHEDEPEEVQLSEADDKAEEWKAPDNVPMTAAPGRRGEQSAAAFQSAAASQSAEAFESAADSQSAAASQSA